jgi:hypothetical protein
VYVEFEKRGRMCAIIGGTEAVAEVLLLFGGVPVEPLLQKVSRAYSKLSCASIQEREARLRVPGRSGICPRRTVEEFHHFTLFGGLEAVPLREVGPLIETVASPSLRMRLFDLWT